jgi:hypothetical protein
VKKYYHLQIFIASFLAFYVTLGIFARIVLRSQGELFPIYTWALFSRVPNEQREFALRIRAVGCKVLESPLYFQDAGQWFRQAESISAYVSIQKLGSAVLANDIVEIDKVRRLLESVYLRGPEGVRYEVVERKFNPMDRWKYGTFRSEKSLEGFHSFAYEMGENCQ